MTAPLGEEPAARFRGGVGLDSDFSDDVRQNHTASARAGQLLGRIEELLAVEEE
jgi:hypothetical protein